jgi:hypothetical protein
MACLAGLIWILGAIPAQAACTGGGTTWSCPAGASVADVQNAINASSDGAVITFAAGSYTWGTGTTIQFAVGHGDTLICAIVGACTVSASNTIWAWPTFSANNTYLYRISGFDVTTSSTNFVIYACPGGTCNGQFNSIRIDHNTFNVPAGTEVICFCDGSSAANYYGVIDHNTVNSSGSSMLLIIAGTYFTSGPASPLGTANNMFVENNTINIAASTDASMGCMDSWGMQAVVWRYNTTTNCLLIAHDETHAGGPTNVEIYNNNIQMNSGAVAQGIQDCYRCVFHQGANELIVWGNQFTPYSGHNGAAINLSHYRDYAYGANPPTYVQSIDQMSSGIPPCSGTMTNYTLGGILIADGNRSPTSTWYGYPCWHQPGRSATGTYMPIYSWNNRWTDISTEVPFTFANYGGTAPPSCSGPPNGTCDYFAIHMIQNRDNYDAVSVNAQSSSTSPFNGTTGMGFGTLANRPTSCTTNSTESGAGVGYFATDQGAQGTLYTCSATNTWAVFYTPYTYPHPLTQGDTQPAPPTGLQASVN